MSSSGPVLALASDGLFSTLLSQYEEELNLLEGMLGTDFFDSYTPLTPYGEKTKARYDGRMTSYPYKRSYYVSFY